MWRLVLIVLGLVAACGRPAPSQPRPIDQLATTIQERDYLAAYDLMPKEFRWVYSRSDFVRMMAGEVITPGAKSPKPREAFTNGTPREALDTFVRAWKLKRWDVIVRLTPTAFSSKLTADEIRVRLERPD